MIKFYPFNKKKTAGFILANFFCIAAIGQCLIVSGDVSDVKCYGTATGAIDVSVTGGSGIYDYTWTGTGGLNNGSDRINLIAGNYTLTVKDHNNPSCSGSKTFIVNEPPPLNIEWIDKSFYNGFGVSCANSQDGQLSVFVSGGAGSYQYSINDGPYQSSNVFANLPAGTYYATVKDANGCLVTSDPNSPLPHSIDYVNPLVNIIAPSPLVTDPISVLPISTGTADSIVIFASQTVTLVAGNVTGGIAPYNFEWSNGSTDQSITVTPTSTTVYTLTITDVNGCTTKQSFKVVVNSISGGGGTGGGGSGGGGTGGQVVVCHNGKMLSVSLSALPAHVRHGDNIGYCLPFVTKHSIAGEDNTVSDVIPANKIYPNPSAGKFAIRLTNISSKLEIQVVNALGIVTEKRVITNVLEETIQQFDLTGKPSGIYFIKVSGASIRSEVYRVLIK